MNPWKFRIYQPRVSKPNILLKYELRYNFQLQEYQSMSVLTKARKIKVMDSDGESQRVY